MFRNLLQDLRGGARVLLKRPAFTAVAVLSLGLGIGANTAIFTIINAVFLNPLPVEKPSRVVEVFTRDTRTVDTSANFALTPSSLPNYEDYRDRNGVFSGLAAQSFPIAVNWSGNAEPEQVNVVLASANYFDVLGVRPAAGRTFLSGEDKKVGGDTLAVLSYSLWTRRFGGNRNVLGQTLRLNGDAYTVIGVAPPNFKGTFTLAGPDVIWVPVSMRTRVLTGFALQYADNRRFRWLGMVGRLKDGVQLEQASSSLKIIASALEKTYPNENRGRTVELKRLSDTALGVNQQQVLQLAGGVMMAVVGLVLLIACVNLANLLMAQAAEREKEITIRAAMGASRGRLVRQLLTESVLLAGLGGGVGLGIANWGRAALWSFRPPFLNAGAIELSLDGRVLAFTAGIAVLTGLLFGIFPALRASRVNLSDVLKAAGRGSTVGWRQSRLRTALVVCEMGLTLVALTGAGLFTRSMRRALQIDPGFESKKLIILGFDLNGQHYDPDRGQEYFRAAIERVRNLPGVESAAVATNFPLGGGVLATTFREAEINDPNRKGTLITIDVVAPSFFETLRIPLHRGRLLTDFDRDNTKPVAVINETAAKLLWPGDEALGKRFAYVGSPMFEVVGVVADSAILQIGEDPQPALYFPMRQHFTATATLQVRTSGDPKPLLGSVRSVTQELDRNLALTNVQTIQDLLDQALWAPRMGAALLGLFGLIALVLATIGIYGVMAYSVAQRTSEIGVRVALGAKPWEVQGLVLKQGMQLALLGAALGVALSLALAPITGKLLYGVSARDPLTITGVTLLLSLVAAAACYIPARRATRVDPIVALRYE